MSSFGYIVLKDSVKLDIKKTKSLTQMQPSEEEKQLISVLQSANYLNKSSLYFVALTKLFYNISSKNSYFI